jgi:hypothetical protein
MFVSVKWILVNKCINLNINFETIFDSNKAVSIVLKNLLNFLWESLYELRNRARD